MWPNCRVAGRVRVSRELCALCGGQYGRFLRDNVRVAATEGVTRPNRVRLRYGSWVRLTRLHQRGLLHARACSATLMNGLFQGKLLSAYKIGQA